MAGGSGQVAARPVAQSSGQGGGGVSVTMGQVEHGGVLGGLVVRPR